MHSRSRSGHPPAAASSRRRSGKKEGEIVRRDGGKSRESGLRVTGPRFIRGERSKVIAQARRGRVSPAGSFRAATPCGRPHPRRRLVHAGSTSSRETTATKGEHATRPDNDDLKGAYDDVRPAELRELIGNRSRSRSIRMRPTRASRPNDHDDAAPETGHSRARRRDARPSEDST